MIDGPMGAGKTTTADLMRAKLSNSIVVGICRIKWLISGFSCNKKEYKIATDIILTICQRYLHYRKTIIIEQCFRKKNIMSPYLALAKKNHLPIFIYELHAPKKVLLNRIKQRPKNHIKLNQISRAKILKNIDSYPHPVYAPVRIYFDTQKLSARKVCNAIIKDIQSA